MGAVGEGGSLVVNERGVRRARVGEGEFAAVESRDRAEVERGALRLDAKWSFSCTTRKSRGRADRTFREIPLGEASPAGIATATAEALGRLADVLAAQAPCEGPELAR